MMANPFSEGGGHHIIGIGFGSDLGEAYTWAFGHAMRRTYAQRRFGIGDCNGVVGTYAFRAE